MKAYIIIAHKNPTQVARLVQALRDGNAQFFLHIDLKVDLEAFRCLLSFPDVHWVERVDASWGEFGLTQATINGLRTVRATGLHFAHIIVLSGQDYPIRSNKVIDETLKNAPFTNFIEYFLLPNHQKWKPNGGMYRVNKYFLGMGVSQRYLAKAMNFLGIVLPPLRRSTPKGMRPFAGSNWWIIDTAAMEYILKYIDENPAYTRYHQQTFVADELFFHMILLNAPDQRLLDSISNDNKRFIIWKEHAAHPEWLGLSHLESMLQSDALFARKFDIDRDAEVLDAIDQFRATDQAVVSLQTASMQTHKA